MPTGIGRRSGIQQCARPRPRPVLHRPQQQHQRARAGAGAKSRDYDRRPEFQRPGLRQGRRNPRRLGCARLQHVGASERLHRLNANLARRSVFVDPW